jgi:glutaredoxin
VTGGDLTKVTLYGKAGCCLCDEAKEALAAVRAERPFDLEEVDVSVDPALNREYGERIPVVAVAGEELFEYHVEPDELRQRLDTLSP